MALDQFMLESLDEEEPVFYLWQNSPSVIVGRNQSVYAEVNLKYLEDKGITLARRVTGGGAVYHDLGNLNYSIVGPLDSMAESYGVMEKALQRLGVNAVRSGRNDILVEGRKCSGYAKSMSKGRMMIHGTLMWDVDLEALTAVLAVPGSKLSAAGVASVRSRVANMKTYLPGMADINEFRAALQEILADGDQTFALSAEQLTAVDKLADEKFRTWDWIYGHSPAASFKSAKKFSCGTVEANYTLTHGVFSVLHFTGDFIGRNPADQLAASLIGQKPEAILHEDVSVYFDNLSPAELLQLFLHT